MSTQPMTLNGKMLLEAELKELTQVERPKVILAIEEARSHGDLSENADYDAAKERQGFIESRIADLKGKLAEAQVVDPSRLKSETVIFGAHVKLLDCESEDELTYQIVGEDESDVRNGKLSVFSPLARSIIGKKKGDSVEFQSPKGEKEYEILNLYFE
ncbi:MAG: transcription elongation factor GreA [Bdellovibrionaceae bacterium]|jgi:transcription elongation factor GreA|nr:transcription elongation factor GreA [Pseudobdellovibrionaceae bacterium]